MFPRSSREINKIVFVMWSHYPRKNESLISCLFLYPMSFSTNLLLVKRIHAYRLEPLEGSWLDNLRSIRLYFYLNIFAFYNNSHFHHKTNIAHLFDHIVPSNLQLFLAICPLKNLIFLISIIFTFNRVHRIYMSGTVGAKSLGLKKLFEKMNFPNVK